MLTSDLYAEMNYVQFGEKVIINRLNNIIFILIY